MAQSGPPTPPRPSVAAGNPGYLVAGVLFYGVGGWLLDRWLETHFLVVVGILLGAALGIYMTFGRYAAAGPADLPNEQDPSRSKE